MLKRLNEDAIQKQWSPVIEKAANGKISSSTQAGKDKLKWLSLYAHQHKATEDSRGGGNYFRPINEQVWATPKNVPGMGPVTQPGDPGYMKDFSTQSRGSGDIPKTTLPIALQVAAQCIALDLVPVVPMDGPMSYLVYKDTIYGNGKLNGTSALTPTNGYMDNRPELVEFALAPLYEQQFITNFNTNVILPGAHVRLTNAAVAPGDFVEGKFITRSRITGNPIVLVSKDPAITTYTGRLDSFITTGAGIAFIIGGVTVSGDPAGVNSPATYVKALENHISGYSGAYIDQILQLTSTATLLDIQAANAYIDLPFLRGDGEELLVRDLNLNFFNKSVAAQTLKVNFTITREQIQDAPYLGFDVKGSIQQDLTNETTQVINKHILHRLFALGATHAQQLWNVERVHFNVNWDDATSANILFNLGMGANGTAVSLNVPASAAPPPYPPVLTGGETHMSAQRRVLDRILTASNMIQVRGRRGPADCMVTNAQVAGLLQTISQFVISPMVNTFNQNGGELYPVGSISGVTVYVDPNMAYNDTRFVVFRKGDGISPGLIMMPYMLGESIDIIAEGTMAPKTQLMSRYAVVEAGHHPQIYYITGVIKIVDGDLFT